MCNKQEVPPENIQKTSLFKSKIFKKISFFFSIALTLLGLYCISFHFLVSSDDLKLKSEQYLEKILNKKVSLQNASISPFGKFAFEDVVLNNRGNIISIKLVSGRINLPKALFKRVELSNVCFSGVSGNYYISSDKDIVGINNKISNIASKASVLGVKSFYVSDICIDDANVVLGLKRNRFVIFNGEMKIESFNIFKPRVCGETIFDVKINKYDDNLRLHFLFEYYVEKREIKIENIYLNDIMFDGVGKIILLKNKNIFYDFSLQCPYVKSFTVSSGICRELGFRKDQSPGKIILVKKSA